MQKTIECLKTDFSDDILASILDAINHAYEENIELFNPEIGHDAMTFGLMVYKSKVCFLSQLAEKYETITVLQKSTYFSLKIGRYRVSTYCAGHSDEIDIANAFPKNRTRVPRIVKQNQDQLRFSFMEEGNEVDDSSCLHLIINDIGNPRSGLQKVFLGIPIEISDRKRITKWGTVLEIWSADAQTPTLTMPTVKEVVPVEQVNPPTLTLKETKKMGEGK